LHYEDPCYNNIVISKSGDFQRIFEEIVHVIHSEWSIQKETFSEDPYGWIERNDRLLVSLVELMKRHELFMLDYFPTNNSQPSGGNTGSSQLGPFVLIQANNYCQIYSARPQERIELPGYVSEPSKYYLLLSKPVSLPYFEKMKDINPMILNVDTYVKSKDGDDNNSIMRISFLLESNKCVFSGNEQLAAFGIEGLSLDGGYILSCPSIKEARATTIEEK